MRSRACSPPAGHLRRRAPVPADSARPAPAPRSRPPSSRRPGTPPGGPGCAARGVRRPAPPGQSRTNVPPVRLPSAPARRTRSTARRRAAAPQVPQRTAKRPLPRRDRCRRRTDRRLSSPPRTTCHLTSPDNPDSEARRESHATASGTKKESNPSTPTDTTPPGSPLRATHRRMIKVERIGRAGQGRGVTERRLSPARRSPRGFPAPRSAPAPEHIHARSLPS